MSIYPEMLDYQEILHKRRKGMNCFHTQTKVRRTVSRIEHKKPRRESGGA